MITQQLRITEIFYSLQGESLTTGLPTIFIRLTGCPLRCTYCDTAYAFSGGKIMSLAAILTQVADYNCSYITVTGGEPLAQKDCLILLSLLADQDYQVSLETSGAIDISSVDKRIVTVMDLKTPGSGEQDKNLYSNLSHLKKKDQLKFVIGSEYDYQWAKQILLERQLNQYCEILFSPSADKLSAKQLADWILRDNLPVRLQIQLHKILWGNTPGT